MKMKRYFAPDMRRAIQQVRTDSGPDAVIMSTRTCDGGVEIMVAVDYDAGSDLGAAVAGAVAPDVTPGLAEMQGQLDAMQTMLRQQFAQLSLGEPRAVDPERALLARRIHGIGLDSALAEALLDEVEHPGKPDRAWREMLFALARRLRVAERDPLDQGGVFALVGPTGVGKTTTIAKLAARHCLRHGPGSVALITTDTYRMGALRQLDGFGEILGLDVHAADSAAALEQLLGQFRDRRLVLVDTAGMAPRDCRLTRILDALDACPEVRRYLVLSATMQTTVMADAVRAFGRGRLCGAVVTKLDEVRSLGPVLSTLVREQLSATWLCDGQRVPEDLKVARVVDLISWAIRWSNESEPAAGRPTGIQAAPREMAHAAL